MQNNKTYNADWSIEIINNVPADHSFKAALFDFDGTLSLIRAGWQEVMLPYFCEEFFNSLPDCKENEEELKNMIRDFIDKLTGKQTIFQCLKLKEEIENRGGTAKDAMDYKNEYLRRLFLKIEDKRQGLADSTISQEELLVKGAKQFIEALKAKGVEVYCASGTDQPQVIEEAKLLGLDGYFENNIFGALDEHARQCSKEVVIKDLIKSRGIQGQELLTFGDGFVEIELVKQAGGYSVAVATDEINNYGIDEHKRLRLLSAGADAVIPNFEKYESLIDFLFNK